MRTLDLLLIALKALRLNKTKAFLTMLGIIIGVASVITMLAIGEGSKASIKKQLSGMGANMITVRPGAGMRGGVRMDMSSSQTLTLEDLATIKEKAKLITNISPQVDANGQAINGANNWPTSIYGVTPEYLAVRMLTVKKGTMINSTDVAIAGKVVVIGQTVYKNLFKNLEDPIGKTIRFNKIPFKVIGLLASKGETTFGQDQDDIILAPYTAVQKRILATTYLQSIVASARSEEVAENAVTELTNILRKSHKLSNKTEDDFNIFSQQEMITTISSTSEMLTVLLVAIAGISLLVGGIGIMNIMYVSVKERTREVGLRMALGGRGIDILLQFLTEAVLISITGGVIGIAVGLGATEIVARVFNWPTCITFYSIVISFAVCTITGIFFGWYPARKAADLDPITALRYE
ncbi:MAG: ABC transporter permease [Bacteroidales bacterium]|nr:ABC transporter permease [Bacteroidales bacterium]MDD4602502.1 ABC transporter permease [Bacteroidales bacterium]